MHSIIARRLWDILWPGVASIDSTLAPLASLNLSGIARTRVTAAHRGNESRAQPPLIILQI
jgi:hypothetical protein